MEDQDIICMEKYRTKYDNCVKEREVTVPNNLIHTSLIWRPGETEKLTLSLNDNAFFLTLSQNIQ